jgi:subtilase family serine protease
MSRTAKKYLALIFILALNPGCDFLPWICDKSDLIIGGLGLIEGFNVDGEVYVIQSGSSIEAFATTRNQGDKEADSFTNQVNLLQFTGGQVMTMDAFQYAASSLDPDEESSERFNLTFDEPGDYELNVVADVLGDVCETNGENNEASTFFSAGEGATYSRSIQIKVVR